MQPDGDLSSAPNRQSKSLAAAVRFESDLRGRGDEREVAATGIRFVESDAEAFRSPNRKTYRGQTSARWKRGRHRADEKIRCLHFQIAHTFTAADRRIERHCN